MVIVYPPTLDYGFMRQRPQQLMTQFARNGHQVYFCERTQQTGRPPTEVEPNLWVVGDHEAFVRDLLPQLGPRLVWCSWAYLHDTLDRYHPDFVVYDCVDDFAEWHPYEPAMLARADAVVVTSTALADRLRPSHSRLTLIPNGCDFDFFNRRPLNFAPRDLPARRQPRAFFMGAWGSWVDSQAVARAARLLPHWDFIIVGPPFGGHRIWGRNIYNLGIRSYEMLPAYLHNVDVCLIPFLENNVTRAANPVKLWEYLAAGKPVVSTPLPEVMPLQHLVRIAPGPQFAQAIPAALADQHLEPFRIAAAKANSWEARYEAIAQFLPELGSAAP